MKTVDGKTIRTNSWVYVPYPDNRPDEWNFIRVKARPDSYYPIIRFIYFETEYCCHENFVYNSKYEALKSFRPLMKPVMHASDWDTVCYNQIICNHISQLKNQIDDMKREIENLKDSVSNIHSGYSYGIQ